MLVSWVLGPFPVDTEDGYNVSQASLVTMFLYFFSIAHVNFGDRVKTIL